MINTPILGQLSQEHIDFMTSRIPLGRVGEPSEVAALICWLASEEMTFSTGRLLRHLRRPGDVLRRFVRAEAGGNEPRVGRIEGDAVAMLDHDDPLAALAGKGEVTGHWDLGELTLLAPIDAPEIWCAGVTYERSRDARLEEAQTEARDVYALVYDADRPELFLKDAQMRRTVGPGGSIRVRSDSSWMVPEPELGVVLGEGGEPVGGHDRQRRLEPRHRGREPALHPAGQGLRRRVRDRAGARGAGRLGGAVPDPAADHRRRREPSCSPARRRPRG